MIACAGIDGLESSILSCIPSAIITENIHNRTKKNRFNGYVSACTMAGALMFSVVGGAIGATGWQKAYYVYFTAVPILLIVLLIMPRESVKKIRMRRPEEITQRYRKKDLKDQAYCTGRTICHNVKEKPHRKQACLNPYR